MYARKAATIGLVGAVIVISTVASAGQRASRGQTEAAKAAVVQVSPVVVVAKKPSLSEILDLVLHERPTAAELGVPSNGAFPAGSEEAHVAGVLERYTSNVSLADRISSALVKEGRRRHIGSSLLVGVLLTENPDLNPNARSSVGARGLMQVMPFHAGKWGCGSSDLFDIESNICHGVAVLADNLTGAKNLPQALLGYNGCVRGTNTPDCRKYPRVVYHRARKGEDSTSKAFVQ